MIYGYAASNVENKIRFQFFSSWLAMRERGAGIKLQCEDENVLGRLIDRRRRGSVSDLSFDE
jgi:hypothetical protein